MKPMRTTKAMILITVIFMDLLAGMEFDLFVPSFPELQAHFGLSSFWVEALLSVNFIGYCLSLFVVGELADRYGRRPIILSGLLIFILGSIFCLWVPSYPFFLAGRFLQGIGVAAPAILGLLLIADAYSLKEQRFLLTMLNGVMNIAVGIAPVIGSYVTLHFHWQGNFMALLLLGLTVLVMTMFCVPNYKLPEHKEATPVSGYLSLLRSRPLLLLIINMLGLSVPYWIFVGISPLLYMKDLGVSLSHFGYYQGVLALVYTFGCILSGAIINRFDQKKMLSVSNQIFIFSFITISAAMFFNSTNPLLITLAFLPFIIGQVLPGNILYPLCLHIMPQAKARISAVMQGGRLILSALSLQVVGYFYQGSFQQVGVILNVFILIGIITLYLIIKNQKLMEQG